ncbi:MAG: DNA replication and repair protein RecF [Chlamydiae bacterium]|nr:DNA replication and repair protein RecF [Chlamydiota bacterium]
MLIKRLLLRQFRCYDESVFEFCPEINLIYGANAQGKTSLLEALHLLAIGRSFRTVRLTDMIQNESESFFLEALFESGGVEQRVAISFSGRERKIVHNNTTYPAFSSLIGLLPVTMMIPDDDLIKGSPDARRKFIDLQISQFDPLYLHYLTRYQRAMRQRNHLLKSQQLTIIDPWEQEMAKAASYVVKKRRQLIEALQPNGQQIHHVLSNGNDVLNLRYQESLEGDYLQQFQKNRMKEVKFGFTCAGPHRDDLLITIGNQEARHFASEGQKRTCVTALRLASWHLLKERIGNAPLMMIDDFGISLDRKRRQQFMDQLSGLGQVFITSVEELQFADRNVQSFEIRQALLN